jgi:lipopolysaccharide/colanic/teichoic acid biosynthesis glycosyltransferase
MAYEGAKRCFDILFSLLVLMLVWPLLVVVAVAIKLDSKGPILYLGRRVGRGGSLFSIYKFRTMVPDAESLGTTTRIGDPRVTRVGGLLRRYKLDELPQFLNVLSGEMSVVGPRPEVEEHTSAYSDEEKAILGVRPGITDFASIRFSDMARELGSEDPHGEYLRRVRGEKNRLRLQYVRTRSFLVDMKIIALTVLAILKKAFPSGWRR